MGFETFLGNSAAVTGVREMLGRGAVPGSLLFAGPEGVGKGTLAAMMAQALNCERGQADYCGECPRCLRSAEMVELARADLEKRREIKDAGRRVDGLVYFDVQWIAPITRFILTDQIRLMRSAAYARPFELARRVFIIDQAQAIHWQAADLLLKVMEEPPATTTIILVCPNPYELRPTLRSRCRRVTFAPVESAVIEKMLQRTQRMPPAELRLASRLVGGSVAAAKDFDLAAFQAQRKPWVEFLGGVAAKDFRAVKSADWKAVFDSTKALAEHRADFDAVLGIGYALLNDMLRILEGLPEERIVHCDLAPRLASWAAKLKIEGIDRIKRGLDDAYRLQNRNVNQQLGWDALATELV